VTTEHPHRHIVSVGVGADSEVPIRTLTLGEVREALRRNVLFYTRSPSTGAEVAVREATCGIPVCNLVTIKSTPDAVTDNNLDELPDCP